MCSFRLQQFRVPRKSIEGRACGRQSFFVQGRCDKGCNLFLQCRLRSPDHALARKPTCPGINLPPRQIGLKGRHLQHRHDTWAMRQSIRRLVNWDHFEWMPFRAQQAHCFLHQSDIARHKTMARDLFRSRGMRGRRA